MQGHVGVQLAEGAGAGAPDLQGVGEMVLSADRREIAALLCGRAEDVQVREGEGPLDFALCAMDRSGRFAPPKSRTLPLLVLSMALLHSLASCRLRSWAMPRSHSPLPGL